MSESKRQWTPGPWECSHLTVKDCRGMIIARVSEPNRMLRGSERREDMEWCKGNAKLIAAVPELVEALQAIAQYGSDTLSGRADGPDDREWQRAAVIEMTHRARAALAKAGA